MCGILGQDQWGNRGNAEPEGDRLNASPACLMAPWDTGGKLGGENTLAGAEGELAQREEGLL